METAPIRSARTMRIDIAGMGRQINNCEAETSLIPLRRDNLRLKRFFDVVQLFRQHCPADVFNNSALFDAFYAILHISTAMALYSLVSFGPGAVACRYAIGPRLVKSHGIPAKYPVNPASAINPAAVRGTQIKSGTGFDML